MPNINLYNQDCMDFMKGLPDKAYELAICDPPYRSDTDNLQRINNLNGSNASIMKGKLAVCKKYDYTPIENNVPDQKYFDELKRVSKNQLVWGYNYFADMIGPCRGPIVWDKQTSGYLADAELCFSSIDRNMKIFKFMWNGMLQENMKAKETREHPTQKPVALYKWLLRNYAKPGDKILDTHGGSGSIAIACYDLGFDLDWMELDKDYFDAAVSRYESHVARYAPASEIPVTKKGEFKLF